MFMPTYNVHGYTSGIYWIGEEITISCSNIKVKTENCRKHLEKVK